MNQVVRPENRREFMNKLVVPYDQEVGNPNSVFSDPAKLGQPENNRARQISVKGDTDKDFYIGMQDLTDAVSYYFNNVLRLYVIQNNNKITIPVIYGTPENWKGVQRDGYYRDKNGKLQAPLIMYKRTTTTPNRNLGNKIDGNVSRNVQLFEKRYNQRNNYGNFAVLTSRSPEKEYVVSVTPDYVTVEFECLLWTYSVEQVDKLIESLNFSSRSYWGDPNKFQFYSQIETFSDSITYDIGEDRAIKTSFTLTLSGYLIPDSVNKKLANANRYYGASQILFGMETATSEEQQQANMRKVEPKKLSRILTADSINYAVNNTGGIDIETLIYLTANLQVIGTFVNQTTATFNKAWAIPPAGLPANSVDNFNFFINGQYLERNAIVSWTDDGLSTSTIVINPAVLSFSFDSTDLILAVGKFKP
jgi:hypothetical protein